jgi:hypothetical protein
MAITVPVDGQPISASTFGAPVANQLNQIVRMGGSFSRVATQSIPNNINTSITFDTETEDTNGFLTPPGTTITIPSGCAGLYVITSAFYTGAPGGALWIVLSTTTIPFTTPSNPVNAWASVTAIYQLPVGATISTTIWQNSGAAINTTGRLALYRLMV